MVIACNSTSTIVCGEHRYIYIFGNNANRHKTRLYTDTDSDSDSDSDTDTDTKISTIEILDGLFDNEQVVMASMGSGHKACVTKEGNLWTWGTSEYGELGHGDFGTRQHPCMIQKSMVGEYAVIMVSCGLRHMLVLTEEQVVWSCGQGRYGQLGHGTTHDSCELTQVSKQVSDESLANIVMVSCNCMYSMALDTKGQLFSWGSNDCGQLGHSDWNTRHYPTPLPVETFAGDAIEFMSAGKFHAAAVTKNGNLYLWGDNTTGQLGMSGSVDVKPTMLPPFDKSPVSTVSCCSEHTIVVLKNGSVWTFSIRKIALGHINNKGLPKLVNPCHFNNEKIVSVAGGDNHSVAVTATGRLYNWGKSDALANDDGMIKWIPTLVDPAMLLGARVGCFHDIPEEHTLAFVMCLHARLGEDCIYVDLEDGIIQLIIELCSSRPEGILRKLPGVVRLLGGGLLLS